EFGIALSDCEFSRACKSYRKSHVFGACPPSAILRATQNHGQQRRVASNEQRTNPLGRTDLVARNGQQVECSVACIDVDLSECLYRIGVKKCAKRLCLSDQRIDGLH